jgi:hypothetical protein
LIHKAKFGMHVAREASVSCAMSPDVSPSVCLSQMTAPSHARDAAAFALSPGWDGPSSALCTGEASARWLKRAASCVGGCAGSLDAVIARPPPQEKEDSARAGLQQTVCRVARAQAQLPTMDHDRAASPAGSPRYRASTNNADATLLAQSLKRMSRNSTAASTSLPLPPSPSAATPKRRSPPSRPSSVMSMRRSESPALGR